MLFRGSGPSWGQYIKEKHFKGLGCGFFSFEFNFNFYQ